MKELDWVFFIIMLVAAIALNAYVIYIAFNPIPTY